MAFPAFGSQGLGPELDESVATAARKVAKGILGQLEDQDFAILKTLEDRGSRDAFELAGEVRIPPGVVLETLAKLDGLGLVVLDESGPAANDDEARFVIDPQRLEALNS